MRITLPSAAKTGGPSRSHARAEVDQSRRRSTTQNHTATHLLNWALREVLCPPGEREEPRVQQKGSLVDPDKTRFDFSHNKPVTPEQLQRIEDLVNDKIAAGLRVYTNENVEVDQTKAREINTLRAVFGENYPERVRVVSIGVPVSEEDARAEGLTIADTLLGDPKNPKWMDYSVEFCGVTHLKNTSDAERFVLISEEGVAKGVRRVVGLSGQAAREAEESGAEFLAEGQALADTPKPSRDREGAVGKKKQPSGGADAPSRDREGAVGAGDSLSDGARPSSVEDGGLDLSARLADFRQRLNDAVIPLRIRNQLRAILTDLQIKAKEQDKQAAAAGGEAVMERVRSLFDSSGTIGDVTVVVGEVPAAGTDAMRSAVDWVRNKTDASAVLLASVRDDRVTLIAGMSRAVVGRGVKAGDLIKEIAPLVGGRGGGRPDMAQGGGCDPAGLQRAMEAAAAWLGRRLEDPDDPNA